MKEGRRLSHLVVLASLVVSAQTARLPNLANPSSGAFTQIDDAGLSAIKADLLTSPQGLRLQLQP